MGVVGTLERDTSKWSAQLIIASGKHWTIGRIFADKSSWYEDNSAERVPKSAKRLQGPNEVQGILFAQRNICNRLLVSFLIGL